MDNNAVIGRRTLPDPEFDKLWDRIVLPAEQKKRVVSQMLLSFTLRGRLDRGAVPLHGVILLAGPPGTGKTSLAKGAASKSAQLLGTKLQYIEAEPHALTSSALGKTQRAMRDFLHGSVAETAAKGPLIVLLDEVETMAASRARMSLEANPIDVHRATDALLAGLDSLAATYPHLLFVATTNFEGAVDEAFISRADLVEYVEKPGADACRVILVDTLTALAEEWPELRSLIGSEELASVADQAVGLDGRQIRKAVLRACALDTDVALNPALLQINHLRRSLLLARGKTPSNGKGSSLEVLS